VSTNQVLYVRVTNNAAITGGGLSQNTLAKKLSINDCDEIVFVITTFKRVLLGLCSLLFKKRQAVFYISTIYSDTSLKSRFKQLVNKMIFERVIKLFLEKGRSKWILDCFLPDFVTLLQPIGSAQRGSIMSVIRSSPHCFSWVSQPNRLKCFAKQLSMSDAFICASSDVADMWAELTMGETPVINLPTPFLENSADKLLIDDFLEDETLNVVMIVGTVGPRKGVNLALRAISKASSTLPGHSITIHIFGSITGWKPDKYSDKLGPTVNIKEHGFKSLNLSVKPLKKCLFLFASYSECFSRAQMEVVALGSPVLVNRYGLDSKIMKNIPSESVFSNHEDLAEKLVHAVMSNTALELDYKPIQSSIFCNSLTENFEVGVEKIRNFG